MDNGVVICRPQGGLNDMLCQIERCCAYAERHDRTVIVDTNHRSTAFFKDSFARYFVSRQAMLSFDTDVLARLAEEADVLPACLGGRVNSYDGFWHGGLKTYVDGHSDRVLSFDFNQAHPQKILVHHAMGGGEASLAALGRMRLHEDLVEMLLERLRAIGGEFAGVHVRNTDYKTNYEPYVDRIARAVDGPLLVASDDRQVIDCFKAAMGEGRVFSFSRLPDQTTQPLHHIFGDTDAFTRNCDAILDLVMLALARRFYGFMLEPNPNGAAYSGFMLLVNQLRCARPVLADVIARPGAPLDEMFAAPLG